MTITYVSLHLIIGKGSLSKDICGEQGNFHYQILLSSIFQIGISQIYRFYSRLLFMNLLENFHPKLFQLKLTTESEVVK